MRTAANTAFLLAILTLGSKLIGFVREIMMANYYGASYVVDAYYVANSIPSMIFAGLFSAVATSFIPLYSKKYEEEGPLQAEKFTSQTINILTVIAIISSLVGILFSDQIVSIASNFQGETANLASFYVKVTFSYTLFTATANIIDAYLKYHNIFLSPSLSGYPVSVICVIFIIISHYTSPYVMIFGFLVGHATRAVIVWFIARHKGYRHKADFHVGDTVKQIFVLALPVFLGTTVGQINLFVNRYLASGLPEGSASALSYGELIIGLITGVTTSIIATILYPKMAQAFSSKSTVRFSELYNSGISILLMIAIPFSIGAILYGEDVIQIIYERGAFDANATSLTYTAFFYYSIGLIFSSLNPFLVQTFYSMHNTKTPLTIAVVIIITNLISNIILVKYLAHGGLALGSTIASFLQTGLLMWSVHRKTDIDINSNTLKKALKLLISALVSIGISYLFYYFVGGSIWMPRMVLMTLTIGIAALFYLLFLKLFKVEELVHFRDIFKIPGK